MRNMKLNSRQFYYANYLTTDEIETDDNAYELTYGTPILAEGSVSDYRGYSSPQFYGLNEPYDRVILTHDTLTGIDESSIIWLEDLNTNHPNDYIVKKVATNLNVTTIAIKKVNVS